MSLGRKLSEIWDKILNIDKVIKHTKTAFYLIMSNTSRACEFCLFQHLHPEVTNNESPTS